MNHVSERALGCILKAMTKLSGTDPTRHEIHEESNAYDHINNTVQALTKLVGLNLVDRYKIDSHEFRYTLTPKGKALLKAPSGKRFDTVRRWQGKDTLLRRCVKCGTFEGELVYFKRGYWCGKCLNGEYIPLELETFHNTKSVFEW